MSKVVPFEPYRLRKRRAQVAAACREAVLKSGMLVVQDHTGRIHRFAGRFSFLDNCLENLYDGVATRLSYDDIKKVKVAFPQHHEHPHSG